MQHSALISAISWNVGVIITCELQFGEGVYLWSGILLCAFSSVYSIEMFIIARNMFGGEGIYQN